MRLAARVHRKLLCKKEPLHFLGPFDTGSTFQFVRNMSAYLFVYGKGIDEHVKQVFSFIAIETNIIAATSASAHHYP